MARYKGRRYLCRCDDCKEANADWAYEHRQARLSGKEHGTRSTYNVGCRCKLCVCANRNYQAGYAAGRRASNEPIHDDTYGGMTL